MIVTVTKLRNIETGEQMVLDMREFPWRWLARFYCWRTSHTDTESGTRVITEIL